MTAGQAADQRLPLGVVRSVATCAARVCGLGTVRALTVITTGFEDCNLDLRTDRGRVIVKAFAGWRPGHHAARTADLLGTAIAHGVRHPRLLPDHSGQLLHTDPASGVAFLVMERSEGRDYYQLGRPPTGPELDSLIEQVVRIHALPDPCDPIADPWAITNLQPMLTQAHPFLAPSQLRMALSAAERLSHVDRDALTHALIHGDLTKGNVLAEPGGQVSVIDFVVATRAPRLLELAVIAANLTHGGAIPLPARATHIADLYTKANPGAPLTRAELKALHPFTFAAATMEFLGATVQRFIHDDTGPETDLLLTLGFDGMRDYSALS